MKLIAALSAATLLAFLLLQGAGPVAEKEELLARRRNLGKAFYENPATPREAVEELRKALELAPGSAREQLNYGLALLRLGKTDEAVRLLQAVQQAAPKLPHSWFNLGITYKKQGEQDKATAQFERMIELTPGEAIAHYNLGALYRLAGRNADAAREFQTAARLDPLLAAPHFQLFNLLRGTDADQAKRELAIFQSLKKQQEGAAIPEDVDWSSYAELLDEMADAAPVQAPAPLRFLARKIPGKANGLAVLDAGGDGRPDVLTWSASEVRLLPAVKIAGGAQFVAAGDYDNDGFPDLCLIENDRAVLLKNEKGQFKPSGIALPAGSYSQAVWLDFDHDYDLDLFLLGSKSVLMRNQGASGFEEQTGSFPFAAGKALAGVTFRAVPDTKAMDLAVSYADQPPVLYRDQLGGRYKPEKLPLPAGITALRAADLDGDGWIDLLASGGDALQRWSARYPVETLGPAGAFAVADLENRGAPDVITAEKIYRSEANGKFTSRNAPAALSQCRTMASADIDLDGRADLVCDTAEFLNRTVTKNGWLRVKLSGVKNLKLADGSEVEVKSGARYQKKTYRGLPLLFGLGARAQVDTVRITWPNGLIQNEVRQLGGRTHAYREAQRLSGSCPMIWSWNGREFEYITDVLGVAPLGASSGDGTYFPVDHEEYIQIPGRSLQLNNGRFDIRITEELSEVAYLDQVVLIAADHPAGAELVTSEKFQSPPFAPFRLYGVSRKLYPVSVEGASKAALLSRDGQYATGFERRPDGVAREHALELDFGRLAATANRAVLYLNGWVDWADGSTFLGASQQKGGSLIPPYLQVRNARGEWQTVVPDMGLPAGKPKTIAVDLTGKFLTGDRRIRIVTNLCVYWDEIFLGEDSSAPRSVLTSLPSASAGLRYRGFSPVRIHPERTRPEMFFYAGARPESAWEQTPGLYTRYGDALELIETVDDRMVVMGSGDELRLQFSAERLPALPAGWSRDFLLKVDGWAKDRDPNTAESQSTGPLPFHSMSRYPYPRDEQYPQDAGHLRYQTEFLTRPAVRSLSRLRAHNR